MRASKRLDLGVKMGGHRLIPNGRSSDMNILGRTLFCAACLLLLGAAAKADTTVSLGYYDLAPCCGNSNPLPNPWYGSSNTTFLGNAAVATSGDPDEAGILFTNTGTTAVTLDQGVTVTSGSTVLTLWDSLIGAGGFSIGAGDSVILSGTTAGDDLDGSDIPLTDSTISFSVNGTAYSVVDTGHSGAVDGSILAGSTNGSPNETIPWTQVDDIGGSKSPGMPEPASVTLLSMGLLGLGFRARRRRS
jgi:hypothetical protein